jgi:aspartate-semialdehyde dehydrogenase
MLLSFTAPLTIEQARHALQNYPGIELLDDTSNDVYPTAATAAGKDCVQIGRLRLDHDGKRLWMWQVTDNLRKGAALNTIQIAEQLFVRRLCQ